MTCTEVRIIKIIIINMWWSIKYFEFRKGSSYSKSFGISDIEHYNCNSLLGKVSLLLTLVISLCIQRLKQLSYKNERPL